MKRRGGGGSGRGAFYLGLAAVAVVGIVLIVWQATRPDPVPAITEVPVTAAQAEGYLLGDPNAPVQILEFADFECPACARYATISHPDVRRRIVDAGLASYRFFDFPLAQHQNSVPASLAAACAAEQGKFWEYHDQLYLGQPAWSTGAVRNPKGIFEDYARQLGLNVEQWEQCYDERKYLQRVLANQAEGLRRGVGSTPTFVVGNKMVPGAIGADELMRLVQEARAAQGAGSPAAPAAGADTAAAGAR